MAQALEEQRKQSNVTKLEFEERLALLVERQWLWKENRALAARLKRAQLKIPNACIEDIDYASHRGLKRAQIDQLRGLVLEDSGHCRENLSGLRLGPASLPRWHQNPLLLWAQALPRPAPGPRRRQLNQTAQKPSESQPVDHR